MGEGYLNPVYPHSCPDPFVLKHGGAYWAYCTGFWSDGRCFGILHSPDLVAWEALGGALEPFADGSHCYWAPEVAYENGHFYLYYSVGNEDYMQIRVAIATRPEGPFVDSGRRLTREQFAIDAHPFQDDDGAWHLFYATDFLEHTHIGTGTVADRLLDPFTLAGRPRPVTRARYDWQVYDPRRASKGGVRWHTVEGSFVLKRKGRYYHMFSGGNWQNISYGVSYATADNLATPDEWEQASDGERVLPILRTLPGEVIGPGHNSVVRGPDNRQLFCIYHRWAGDGSGRVLAIDRLDWAGDRLLVLGPSTTPQPLPNRPTIAGFGGDGERLGEGWQVEGGAWSVREGAAVQTSAEGQAAVRLALPATAGLVEIGARALVVGAARAAYAGATYGMGLLGMEGSLLTCQLPVAGERARLTAATDGGRAERWLALPRGFDPIARHRLRLEIDGRRVRVEIDGAAIAWQGWLAQAPAALALQTDGAPAVFTSLELTVGWEDLFMEEDATPAALGWEAVSEGDSAGWHVQDRQLRATSMACPLIAKGPYLDDYELVVNACLVRAGVEDEGYEICPALGEDGRGPRLGLRRGGAGWMLASSSPEGQRALPLPAEFDPGRHQQFRFRKEGGELAVQWEQTVLGRLPVPARPSRVGLAAAGAEVAFDMVRMTALSPAL